MKMKAALSFSVTTLIAIALTLNSTSLFASDAPQGIVPINIETMPDHNGQFPPASREGDFDGRYLYATLYVSRENTKNKAGIWQSEPGVLLIDSYPINEYVQLISGTLTTTDSDGTATTFKAGDTFVIPKGWQGRWDMESRIRKLYVTF